MKMEASEDESNGENEGNGRLTNPTIYVFALFVYFLTHNNMNSWGT